LLTTNIFRTPDLSKTVLSYLFDEISTKINNKENIIPLDNGCVFKEENGFGNLLCLNINTFDLIIQENIGK